MPPPARLRRACLPQIRARSLRELRADGGGYRSARGGARRGERRHAFPPSGDCGDRAGLAWWRVRVALDSPTPGPRLGRTSASLGCPSSWRVSAARWRALRRGGEALRGGASEASSRISSHNWPGRWLVHFRFSTVSRVGGARARPTRARRRTSTWSTAPVSISSRQRVRSHRGAPAASS